MELLFGLHELRPHPLMIILEGIEVAFWGLQFLEDLLTIQVAIILLVIGVTWVNFFFNAVHNIRHICAVIIRGVECMMVLHTSNFIQICVEQFHDPEWLVLARVLPTTFDMRCVPLQDALTGTDGSLYVDYIWNNTWSTLLIIIL